MVQTPKDEFRKAINVVGVRLKKNGKWLLSHATSSLNDAGPHTRERELLWHQLLALAILTTRADDENTQDLGRDLDESEVALWKDANNLRRPFVLDPVDEPIEQSWKYQAWWGNVRQLQRTLAALLDQFLNPERREIAIPLHEVLYVVPKGKHGRLRFPLERLAIGRGDTRSGVESAVLFRFGKVLGELGKRVKRCQASQDRGCRNKLFLGERSDARFCSKTCRMRRDMRTRRGKVRGKPTHARRRQS